MMRDFRLTVIRPLSDFDEAMAVARQAIDPGARLFSVVCAPFNWSPRGEEYREAYALAPGARVSGFDEVWPDLEIDPEIRVRVLLHPYVGAGTPSWFMDLPAVQANGGLFGVEVNAIATDEPGVVIVLRHPVHQSEILKLVEPPEFHPEARAAAISPSDGDAQRGMMAWRTLPTMREWLESHTQTAR